MLNDGSDVRLRKAFLATLREIRGFATTAEARGLAVPFAEADCEEPVQISELNALGPGLSELVRLHDAAEPCEGLFADLERMEYRFLAELFALGLLHTTPAAAPAGAPAAETASDVFDAEEDDAPTSDEVDAPVNEDTIRRESVHEWVQERQNVLAESGGLTLAQIERWRAEPSSPPRHELVSAILIAARDLPNIDLDADRRLALITRLCEWHSLQSSLVVRNIRLALSHVYRKRGVLGEREALLSGIAGLQTAVRRFELRMGNRFSTYGTVWIRHRLQRADADFGAGIRTPVHDRDRIYRYFRMTQHLEPHVLATMTAAQLSAQIGVDVNELLRVRALVRPVSTHPEVGSFGMFENLFDDDQLRPSEATPPPDEAGTLIEMDRRSRIALEELAPRDGDGIKARNNRARIQDILTARLGLDHDGKMTLEELGVRYGVSRERIRQLETQGLEQLRKAIPKALTPR